MQAPSMKHHIIFGLALAIFGIVPLIVILFKYNFVTSISVLPLDYWFWLCLDAAGWLLIIALLHFFPNSIADALACIFGRSTRAMAGWIFGAVIFAASAAEGIFTGSFLSSAPAIVISNLGFIALASADIRRKPKA